MKCLVLIFLLLASALAQAGEGGWHSSGGELFKDAKNPWFVRNTQIVHYCVQVDEATVSASPRVIRDLIKRALGYWQVEFAKGGMLSSEKGNVSVATQKFEEIDCATGAADVAFKIGFGTLSAKEAEFLQEPRKYIGVSVRTDYDEENLRGRGFVFIASDLGANAYLNTGNLLEQAWKQEQLLFYALLHETGHVFGIPHTGSGLMSEVFLDQMLNKAIYEIFTSSNVESFFLPDSELKSCSLTGADRVWFGVSMDYDCIALARLNTGQGAEMSIIAHPAAGGEWVEIGKLRSLNLNIWDIRNRPAVYLQLNPKQKVFSGEEAAFRSFMVGANFTDFGADAVYVAKSDNLPKSVYLRVTSSSFQILGQQSGKVRVMFNYNSLIGTKLLITP